MGERQLIKGEQTPCPLKPIKHAPTTTTTTENKRYGRSTEWVRGKEKDLEGFSLGSSHFFWTWEIRKNFEPTDIWEIKKERGLLLVSSNQISSKSWNSLKKIRTKRHKYFYPIRALNYVISDLICETKIVWHFTIFWGKLNLKRIFLKKFALIRLILSLKLYNYILRNQRPAPRNAKKNQEQSFFAKNHNLFVIFDPGARVWVWARSKIRYWKLYKI